MSYIFNVESPIVPNSGKVLTAIDDPRLRCLGGLPAAGPWPPKSLRFYLLGYSTRVTQVSWKGSTIEILIPDAASPDDHMLAVKFAHVFAQLAGTGVQPEDSLAPLPPAAFIESFGLHWAKSCTQRETEVLIDLAALLNTLQIPGPTASFFLGPRLLAELRAEAGPLELWQRIQERMLKVQSCAAHRANVLKDIDHGEPAKTLVIWPLNESVLLPPADFLAIHIAKGRVPMVIPWARILELCAPYGSRMDEEQIFLTPADPARRADLIARLEANQEIFPFGPPRRGERPR